MSALVSRSDTALAVGSGDLPVLATPRLAALAEAATVAALSDRLPADLTSVGVRLEVRHAAPTVEGSRVTATACLVAQDGPRLSFQVEVVDPEGVVGHVGVSRVLVDRAGFLARARERARQP